MAYAARMNDPLHDPALSQTVEAQLRQALTEGDRARGSVPIVLGHLLASSDRALFSDEVLARVRGMALDLARQLSTGADNVSAPSTEDKIAAGLLEDRDMLSHIHALALETIIAEDLRLRHGIDPVLSPLFQDLVADRDARIADAAMIALSAQARFVQQQQRMALPLYELPPRQYGRAQDIGAVHEGGDTDPLLVNAGGGVPRADKLADVIDLVRDEDRRALDIARAGISLFASALAGMRDMARDDAILLLSRGQSTRLALALLAAGLDHSEAERQLRLLHPDTVLPDSFERISSEAAATLIASEKTLNDG